MRFLYFYFFFLAACLPAQIAPNTGQFIAKIALEDGTPLQRNPLIELGRSERMGYDCAIISVFLNGNVSYATRWPRDQTENDACPVRIRLTGYKMTDVTLHDKLTVVLRRENSSEGDTVSATSLNVPKDAGKTYTKGVRALNDGKWEAAQHEFERAVQLYPDYAQAWKDLGESFLRQGKKAEAEDAFQHALKADPKYVPPYLALARLDLDTGKNQDASALTTKAIALNSGNSPILYFYDATASARLSRMDDAERSARRAVEVDVENQVPRAEYLLGIILASKGQNKEAVEHLQKYLQRDPKAPDKATVRDSIDHLSSTPDQSPSERPSKPS